ncbi:MAG: hypothetical protein HY811_02880 [Planctomycetes bacterium]|nr:hypothetical protein [Planctomycetota bacterium]
MILYRTGGAGKDGDGAWCTHRFYDDGSNSYGDNNEFSQEELDRRFFHGKPASQKQPFTVREIAYLVARIYIHLPEDLPVIQCLYYNNFKWRKACEECDIPKSRLANILKTVRHDYSWLVHFTDEGHISFTTREIITLITRITLRLKAGDRDIIIAFYHNKGEIDETAAQMDCSRSRVYYVLSLKVKKPYLSSLN